MVEVSYEEMTLEQLEEHRVKLLTRMKQEPAGTPAYQQDEAALTRIQETLAGRRAALAGRYDSQASTFFIIGGVGVVLSLLVAYLLWANRILDDTTRMVVIFLFAAGVFVSLFAGFSYRNKARRLRAGV